MVKVVIKEEKPMICRTCGAEDQEMTSVFNMRYFQDVEMLICDAIMKCAAVQIQKDDGLPEEVCTICVADLTTAFLFKKRAEELDIRWRAELAAKKASDCLDIDMKDEHKLVKCEREENEA